MRKNNEHAKDKMHVASRVKQLIVYSIENKLISGIPAMKLLLLTESISKAPGESDVNQR